MEANAKKPQMSQNDACLHGLEVGQRHMDSLVVCRLTTRIDEGGAEMNLPRFTAEASLYMRGRTYWEGARPSKVDKPPVVVAQQGSGCTTLCSDWQGCKTQCGDWPPGFSNAQCWINCLAPTINCLQGSVCGGLGGVPVGVGGGGRGLEDPGTGLRPR